MKNKDEIRKNPEGNFKTMEFNGYKFPYNPSSFEIIYEKQYSLIQLPFKGEKIQSLGQKSAVIKGEGEFFGGDIFYQFENLENIFLKDGSGILLLPSNKKLEAVFLKLKMVGEAGADILKYAFEFREVAFGYQDYSSFNTDLVRK